MNLLEYLIKKNSAEILSSIYQNTIYNGETICEFLGVESKTKKDGESLERLVNNILIKDMPYMNIKLIGLNKELYKEAPNFYLRRNATIYNIKEILKYIDNKIVPIDFSRPTPLNPIADIHYYDFLTNNEFTNSYNTRNYEYSEEFWHQVKWLCQTSDNIKILSELTEDDYLKFKLWIKEKGLIC